MFKVIAVIKKSSTAEVYHLIVAEIFLYGPESWPDRLAHIVMPSTILLARLKNSVTKISVDYTIRSTYFEGFQNKTINSPGMMWAVLCCVLFFDLRTKNCYIITHS